MTHLFPVRRPLFAEARLARFAAPGETPSVPDTPPAAETRAEKAVDPRAAFRGAQERIQAAGAKMKKLQDSLGQIQQLRDKVKGGTATEEELQQHGIVDGNGDGSHQDDVDAKVAATEAELKTHADDMSAASTEADQHLTDLQSKGMGGKIDAAFLRVDAALKNPNASMGEKLGAILTAFAEVQAALKGITSPTDAPSAPARESGDAAPSGPKAEREAVRAMMKDANKDSIADLKTDKEQKLTALKGQKGALEGTVATAKTNLANEQVSLTAAKTALDQDAENPAKKQALREAEAKVMTADAAVKASEQQLASLVADITKAEADVKTIKKVEEDAKKPVDAFNAGRGAISAALLSVIEKTGDADVRADLNVAYDALKNNNASVAPNGIDVSFKLPATVNVVAFQRAFADQGVTNTADFGIDPATNAVGNPDALMKGIQQLIAKAEAKSAKPATPVPAAEGPKA